MSHLCKFFLINYSNLFSPSPDLLLASAAAILMAALRLSGDARPVTCAPKSDPHIKLEWWIEGRKENEQKVIHAAGESPL